jgi:glyceraldehyde-3-phosphate dehydrogenase/erythrose-4-phosphate dehydrogenase
MSSSLQQAVELLETDEMNVNEISAATTHLSFQQQQVKQRKHNVTKRTKRHEETVELEAAKVRILELREQGIPTGKILNDPIVEASHFYINRRQIYRKKKERKKNRTTGLSYSVAYGDERRQKRQKKRKQADGALRDAAATNNQPIK